MSTMKLNDMLENGEVLAEDLLPKLAKVLEEDFAVAALDASNRAQGSFNRLANSVQKFKEALGEAGLTDFFANLANISANAINSLNNLLGDETAMERLERRIKEADDRLKELRGEISGPQINAWERYKEAINAVAQASGEYVEQDISELNEAQVKQRKRVDETTLSYLKLEEVIKRFPSRTAISEQVIDYEGRLKKEKEILYELEKLNADSIERRRLNAIESAKKIRDELLAQAKKNTSLRKEIEDAYQVAVIKANQEAAKERQDILDKAAEKRKKTLDKERKEYDKALKKALDPLKKSVKEREDAEAKLNKNIKKLSLSEYDYKIYLLNEEVKKFRKAGAEKTLIEKYEQEKRLEIWKEAADEQQEILKEAYDEIYDHAKDFTDEIVDNWDNLGDTLVDMAKDMVKDIAAAFLAQNIVMPVMMSIGGAMGLATTGGVPYASLGGIPGGGGNLLSMLSTGRSAYSLLSGGGGISQSVANLLGTGPIGNLGASLFGAGAWGGPMGAVGGLFPATSAAAYTAYTPAMVSSYGIPVGVASPGSLAAASPGTGIVGGISAAAPWALGGSLGYSMLGDMLGLPTSELSGITAGLGAGGGYTLGAGLAGLGGLGGPIGAIAGTLLGGVIGGLFGDDEPVPDVRIGSLPGQIISASTHDIEGSGNRQRITEAVNTYFEDAFTAMDEVLDASIVEAVREETFRGRIRLDKIDEGDPDALITALVRSAFSEEETRGEWAGNLTDTLMSAIGLSSEEFDLAFLEDIQQEGENLLDTFTKFALVVENTDDFLGDFTRQTEELGLSIEEAYENLLSTYTTLETVDQYVETLSDSSTIVSIDSLLNSWELLIEALENAEATVEQITEAEHDRNEVIGAGLTGITTDILASELLQSGDDINRIIAKQIDILSASIIAEDIYGNFISQINEEVGAVFAESDYDLNAVVDYLKSIDTSDVQAEILNLKSSFGLLEKETSDLSRSIDKSSDILSESEAEEYFKEEAAIYIKTLESEISTRQSAIDELYRTIDGFDALKDSIRSVQDEIIGTTLAITEPTRYSVERSKLTEAYTSLLAGDTSMLEDIPELVRVFNIASERYQSTIGGTQEDFGFSMRVLNLAASMYEGMGTQEEKQIAELEEQNDHLQSLVDSVNYMLSYFGAGPTGEGTIQDVVMYGGLGYTRGGFDYASDEFIKSYAAVMPFGSEMYKTLYPEAREAYMSSYNAMAAAGTLPDFVTGETAKKRSRDKMLDLIRSLGVMPELADGGIVVDPTVALIGEAGPEAVIPLDHLNNNTEEKLDEVAELLMMVVNALGDNNLYNKRAYDVLDSSQKDVEPLTVRIVT